MEVRRMNEKNSKNKKGMSMKGQVLSELWV